MDSDSQVWRQFAACVAVGANPADFFTPVAQIPDYVFALCAGCKVSNQCLTYALETNSDYGVFGGTTGRQRIAMRKRTGRWQYES